VTVVVQSELLDIAQAAALLQVSEASLRRWTNGGRLPCLRIGGRRERRFRRADLMAFLEGQPSATPAGHLCGFYTSDLGRTRLAAGLLGDRLEAGWVCFLAAEPEVRERIIAQLVLRRPALQRDIDGGRLVLTEYAEVATAQLQYWDNQLSAATDAGGRSLQVVGDVSGWCLRRPNAFGEVLEYEVEYGTLARRFPVATACLYDARAHSGLETAHLLRIHADLFHHPVDRLVS
jgi:transcriptional repressor of dcmA and dcmR